jgi:hypothetical protein
MKAEQSVRHSVKCSRPTDVTSAKAFFDILRSAARFTEDPRCAPCQFCRCATGERQQQDALGIYAVENQVRDTMG